MNPFSHLPEQTFDILTRWSYIQNLEVLIQEISNMSPAEKTAIKNSLTLILCNFNFYFSSLKMEFARADLFLKNKCKLGQFDKTITLTKTLKSITKSLDNLKFRKHYDLPKYFIKTYKNILLDYAEALNSRKLEEKEFQQLSSALDTLKETFINYEKFCANFTCHLKSQFN